MSDADTDSWSMSIGGVEEEDGQIAGGQAPGEKVPSTNISRAEFREAALRQEQEGSPKTGAQVEQPNSTVNDQAFKSFEVAPKNAALVDTRQGVFKEGDVKSSAESVQNRPEYHSNSSKYRRPNYTKFDVGVAEKPTRTWQVAQLETSIPRPKGSLPSKSLDTWKELNPAVKLPDIRNRAIGEVYYTRGRLGQKLHRKKPDFELGDPYNRRTVVDTKEYTALHDPHCKGYFKQPSVMEHLKRQELVNNKGEVLCNVNEFNQYRSYLGSLFNNQVQRRISEKEAVNQMERSLKKDIHLQSRQVQSHQLSKANFRESQSNQKRLYSMYDAAKKQRYIAKIAYWHKRLQEIEKNKRRAMVARSGEYTAKHWSAYLTRKKASKLEVKRKRDTLARIAYTEVKNAYVTKYDEFVKLALFERYKADQAAVMIARDGQIADMEQLVAETLKRSKANWMKQYGAFIERNREAPVQSFKAGKRGQYLMKKYFRKWRRIVMQNREIVDKRHHTVFQIRNKLRPLVAYMEHNIDKLPLGGEGDELKLSDLEADTSKISRPSKVRASIPSQRGSQDGRKLRASQSGRVRKSGMVRKSKLNFTFREDDHKGDLDEADGFIDNVVSQYTLESDLLKTKLKTRSAVNIPPLPHHRHTIVGRDELLDEYQEDQTERIKFLHTM